MSDERDRLVTVGVLNDALRDLESRLGARISEQAETTRQLEDRIGARITQSEETIRRHFDIMVEKVNDSVKIVAEATAHHSKVLDDHETRLQKIERRA